MTFLEAPQYPYDDGLFILNVMASVCSAFAAPHTIRSSCSKRAGLSHEWCTPTLHHSTQQVDLLFAADMFVNFRLGFFDNEDDNVWTTSSWGMAQKYLKGWFIPDLVSIVPWWLLADSIGSPSDGEAAAGSQLKAIKIVRLLRLIKLIRMVRTSRASVSDNDNPPFYARRALIIYVVGTSGALPPLTTQVVTRVVNTRGFNNSDITPVFSVKKKGCIFYLLANRQVFRLEGGMGCDGAK